MRILYSIIFLSINQDLLLYLGKKDKGITSGQCCKIYKDKYLETNTIKRENEKKTNALIFWHSYSIFQIKDLICK